MELAVCKVYIPIASYCAVEAGEGDRIQLAMQWELMSQARSGSVSRRDIEDANYSCLKTSKLQHAMTSKGANRL